MWGEDFYSRRRSILAEAGSNGGKITSYTTSPVNILCGNTLYLSANVICYENYNLNWQKYYQTGWGNINGATGINYTKTNIDATDSGLYRLRVTDSLGNEVSKTGEIQVNVQVNQFYIWSSGKQELKLTTTLYVVPRNTPAPNPLNPNPCVGGDCPPGKICLDGWCLAGSTTIIQWQYSNNGGSSWLNVPAGTPDYSNPTGEFLYIVLGPNTTCLYRAVISAPCFSTTYSQTFELCPPLNVTISTNKTSYSVGESTPTLIANSPTANKFQWQVDEGTGFQDIQGAAESTYKIPE
jgi:hypothetical protein